MRWSEILLGRAKDPLSPRVFHMITLAAFFAWVGLGADGLSSSCYGPEEAFKALGKHSYLALPLAGFMALTVFVISASYSQLIEVFPSGGGGYVVTTKLLGKGPGVVCGCALVLDYILTIAISISSGVDALFSSVKAWGWEHDLGPSKVFVTLAILLFLILINLRGVKESILLLLPIFLVFLTTHLVAILTTVVGHSSQLPALFIDASAKAAQGAREEGGWLGILAVFFAAYSIGGGTYTGIEAVSNSMQILREPRVATGKRTMLYMSISLAFTASGILLGYLIYQVKPEEGRTLNAVLFDRVFGGIQIGDLSVGHGLVVATLLSEGALLFVAAQAGFIGGPRTLATMAHDQWVPTRFSHLSSRLVVQDGVIFMGGAAAAFVVFTGARVELLVILYSINVFLTFTLSQLAMCVHWFRTQPAGVAWRRKVSINGLGLFLSALVLVMMVYFKFPSGGWVTLLITALSVLLCYFISGHYEKVRLSLRELDLLLDVPVVRVQGPPPEKAPGGPTGVVLVSRFNGLGLHSFLTILRLFPNHFKNFVFLSVGVVDFEEFKDPGEIRKLRRRTAADLEKYVDRARGLGFYAEHRHAFGTELAVQVEKLAQEIVKEFPGAIFFGGQLVFRHENFFTRSLHSQAAFEIQRRLQFSGLAMVLLPVRVHQPP